MSLLGLGAWAYNAGILHLQSPSILMSSYTSSIATMVSATDRLQIVNNPDVSPQEVTVAVMGATGTGKSSFIQLLTKDQNIQIGHGQESQTDQINTFCYSEPSVSRSVRLVDTPGFDDSRDGMSDVDILEKIAKFLQDEGGRKLNGIIYMHRISDPRMGGSSRKNLRMFKQLCGDGTLKNVCIVTTNWNRVTESEGAAREKELGANGNFFKPLLDAGARLIRHDKGLQSAQVIMSNLVHKTAVTTQLQAELKEGRVLQDTSAGSVLSEEIKELIEKHQKAMLALKQEMEKAVREKNEAFKAELEEERHILALKMEKAEQDRKKLEKMVEKERNRSNIRLRNEKIHRESSLAKAKILERDVNKLQAERTVMLEVEKWKQGTENDRLEKERMKGIRDETKCLKMKMRKLQMEANEANEDREKLINEMMILEKNSKRSAFSQFYSTVDEVGKEYIRKCEKKHGAAGAVAGGAFGIAAGHVAGAKKLIFGSR